MTTLDVNCAANTKSAPFDRWIGVVCLVFFLAGIPALIYQLTWQRSLFRIFGVNIESVTIVVTAFMLGLGIGSLAGGWLSKWNKIKPLAALAMIELATGAIGVVSLAIFDKVEMLTAGLSLLATGTITLALVIAPTLLMGATLPFLVAHVAQRFSNVGSAVGLLYFVNTLGAGIACLLAALVLFPFLGMRNSVYMAVAMNVIVALIALVGHKYEAHLGSQNEALKELRSSTPNLAISTALILAGAGGFVSLSYEIFFFRAVSFATGSNASAFAITLSVFLIGLASGGRDAGRKCEKVTDSALTQLPVNALIKANLVGIVFLPLLNHLTWFPPGTIIALILMVFLTARYWGSLLPYLAGISVRADNSAGMHTALLYVANIVGSAAGSIITGFILMDRFGLVAINMILVLAGLLCIILLIGALRFPRPHQIRYGTLVASMALIGVLTVPFASKKILETLQWKGVAFAQPFIQIVENRSGIITVTKDGTVYGNGIFDGQFNIDLKTDTNGIVRPYALSLFHPTPRQVLMIGLSSGSWAQVIANNPHVESLTIVEINPGYLSLIRTAPEVSSLLKNTKAVVITDDGRRWLRANPQRKFDAIVSNTTFHFRSNATNLLSVEFLEIIRRHLHPGGIFFYNTTSSDRVQRTGCVSFADGARFLNHVVLSDTPIFWDFARWRRTLEAYSIDGKEIFQVSNAQHQAKLDELVSWQKYLDQRDTPGAQIERCSDILVRTAGKELVTDDNMGSEWRHGYNLE
jgi:spermidine synthase